MRQESIVLTKEIISHIMGNIGFVPNKNFGKFGASTDNFIINKEITISDSNDEEVDKKQNYKIWGAKSKINNSIFRILFTNLTNDDNIIDYLLVLRVDSGPIHAMSLSFYKDEISYYFLFFDKKYKENITKKEQEEDKKLPDFIEASTYDKCMALAGIELITQLGVDWEELDGYDDLYEAITKLAEK